MQSRKEVKTSPKDREAKVIALARVGSSPETCRGRLAANSLGDDPVATWMRAARRARRRHAGRTLKRSIRPDWVPTTPF